MGGFLPEMKSMTNILILPVQPEMMLSQFRFFVTLMELLKLSLPEPLLRRCRGSLSVFHFSDTKYISVMTFKGIAYPKEHLHHHVFPHIVPVRLTSAEHQRGCLQPKKNVGNQMVLVTIDFHLYLKYLLLLFQRSGHTGLEGYEGK